MQNSYLYKTAIEVSWLCLATFLFLSLSLHNCHILAISMLFIHVCVRPQNKVLSLVSSQAGLHHFCCPHGHFYLTFLYYFGNGRYHYLCTGAWLARTLVYIACLLHETIKKIKSRIPASFFTDKCLRNKYFILCYLSRQFYRDKNLFICYIIEQSTHCQ